MDRREFTSLCAVGAIGIFSGCGEISQTVQETSSEEVPEELNIAKNHLERNEEEFEIYQSVIDEQQMGPSSFNSDPFLDRANSAKEEINSLKGQSFSQDIIDLAKALRTLANQHIAAIQHWEEYIDIITKIEEGVDYLDESQYQRAISTVSGAEFSRQRADTHASNSIDLLNDFREMKGEDIDWVDVEEKISSFTKYQQELDALEYVILARESEFRGFKIINEGHEEYRDGNYSTAEFKYNNSKEHFSSAHQYINQVINHEAIRHQLRAFFEYGKLRCELSHLEQAAHHYEVGAQDMRRGDQTAAEREDILAEEELTKADECRDGYDI